VGDINFPKNGVAVVGQHDTYACVCVSESFVCVCVCMCVCL